MDFEVYEQRINDVIVKCPIEVGVEILVFNVLFDLLGDHFSIVDVSTMWPNRESRLETAGGIPDIAIVSQDFEYRGENGIVFGFVEVKAPSVKLVDTEQLSGHIETNKHVLYTNGLEWKYYAPNCGLKWEISLCECGFKTATKRVKLSEEKYLELRNKISAIKEDLSHNNQ